MLAWITHQLVSSCEDKPRLLHLSLKSSSSLAHGKRFSGERASPAVGSSGDEVKRAPLDAPERQAIACHEAQLAGSMPVDRGRDARPRRADSPRPDGRMRGSGVTQRREVQ
jgi:hypothetical protein